MGTDYFVLYLEMGSFTACFARYRFERAVPFFEESGSMVVDNYDHVRKRRHFLLVKLCHSFDDARGRFQ